jgi:hypothetical protein
MEHTASLCGSRSPTHGAVQAVTGQNSRSCGGLGERLTVRSHSGAGWQAFTRITIILKVTSILDAGASPKW